MRIIFSVLIIGSFVLTACAPVTNVRENSKEDWLTFESAETDMRIKYPPELTVEFTQQEKAGFDVGRLRSYFFEGITDGIKVDFEITATTEAYGVGIGEGCCFDYSGPALNLNQSDEDLLSDLESGPENYKTDPGKFLEVFG